MRASATHNCSTDPTRHLHGPWRTATGVNALGACGAQRSARDRVTSAGRVAWAVEMSSNAQLNPAAVTWEPSQAPQGRTLPLKMRVSAGRTLCGQAKESTCGSGAACDTGRQADMPALRGCGVGDALRAE